METLLWTFMARRISHVLTLEISSPSQKSRQVKHVQLLKKTLPMLAASSAVPSVQKATTLIGK